MHLLSVYGVESFFKSMIVMMDGRFFVFISSIILLRVRICSSAEAILVHAELLVDDTAHTVEDHSLRFINLTR